MTRSSRARGFTLVEFTIVLVIASLIIGGALKLTSMLDVAKTNDIVAIAGDLSEAMRLFKDKYKAFPGDAPPAVTSLIAGAVAGGDGKGTIDTAAESNAAADHLFLAGNIRIIRSGPNNRIVSRYGDVSIMSFALATDATNSPCGTDVKIFAGPPPANPPVAQHFAVFKNIPRESAQEIDTKFDDGIFDRGSIRASSDYGGDPKIVACFAMPL